MSTVKKITSQKAAEIETGKEVEAFYSDFGKVKAHLQAPVMNHVDDAKNPYTELPSGLHLTFFADSLKSQSELTAGYGISYDKSDQMIARNNVVVTNIYGERLESEELVWDQKTEKISSEKFVKITTRDEVIFGDGFESNDDLSNYKIKKIRGTISVSADQLQ
jgi:LPS export ABC transporter protein LptC